MIVTLAATNAISNMALVNFHRPPWVRRGLWVDGNTNAQNGLRVPVWLELAMVSDEPLWG